MTDAGPRRPDSSLGAPEVEFTGPNRRSARSDRRAERRDRRVGLPDRRLLKRERRVGPADRRQGLRERRRDRRQEIELEAAPDAGLPVTPVPVRRQRRPVGALTAAGVLAAAALVALIAVLATSSGGSSGPPEQAATVVPADALAYAHVSIEPGRRANRRAVAVATRLPDYQLVTAAVTERLGAILSGGQPVDFATQVRPWLGQEAALALLDTSTTTAGSLIVLDVARPARARAFLARQGAQPAGTYGGIPLLAYSTGTRLAFVSHYLVLGQASSVQAAIDASRGRSSSLAAQPGFKRAMSGAADDRALEAYVSASGVRRLLIAQRGVTGLGGSLLDAPTLIGAGISVSASSGGARIRVHRVFDPALARLSSRRQPAFAPALPALIPAGSLGLLDLQGLDRLVPRLLGIGGNGGVGGRLGSLLGQLGSALTAEGIDTSQITGLFDGEAALALVPMGSPKATAAGPTTPSASNAAASASLLLLTRTKHPAQARDRLAALEAPLAQLFPPPGNGPGRAAVFNDVNVDGVDTHQLSLTPGLEFDYAVFHGLIAMSTSLGGIAAAVHHGASLLHDREYQAALSGRPGRVTSLLFLDFSQLLSLGERTGLTRSASLRRLQPDLSRIRAIGLTSTSGEADTTAELSLKIS